ncbi:MAG: cytochrome c biogenesis protein CcdA [Bowdeniella nasicola]|nr:cytochrome c biogenesis protein CcdA [Bowdeniella nasicola]
MGEFFSTQIFSGSLLISIPVALLAGLISFASPCIVPLIPGYVGYLSGLTAAASEPGHTRQSPTGRVAVGLILFVAGFTTVLVVLTLASIFALSSFATHVPRIAQLLGVVVIILGIGFLGYLPRLQTQWQPLAALRGKQVGGFILGVAFALGWSPCIGPTYAAVLTLALSEHSMLRGLVLLVSYSAGLGLPFIAVGLVVARRAALPSWLRTHRRTFNLIGGWLLIILGVLLATGWWTTFVTWMTTNMGGAVI